MKKAVVITGGTSGFGLATAKAFKHLLEMGGTEDPMREYRKFRGADPNPQALLRKRGLIEQ